MRTRLWRGSTLQSILVIVVPLTLVLVAVSFASFQVHQNAMRSLVGDRDERSVRTAASALESEIEHRFYAIQVLSTLVSNSSQGDPESILASSTNLQTDLDFGSAIFNSGGILLAANGHGDFWKAVQASTQFKTFLHPSNSVISGTFEDPGSGATIVVGAITITNSDEVAMGAFSPERLIQESLKDIFPAGGQTAVYVIDPGDKILFHNGPATLEKGPAQHPGVMDAFEGKSGTTFVKSGKDEHVVAYSPIQPVGWAIITEESWEHVSSPTLSTTQLIPLILMPALLLAVLAMAFGARQIVRPLQRLEDKAAKMAWGNFQPIEEPVGGIAEIRDLQQELVHMANQLQAAENSLHSYIGAITKGQEGERLRLARELHDDTIQALIALKQRVQLAEMAVTKSHSTQDLGELENLIEETINNLRRTTRALRPIYLEDLGLTAALEMLAGETSRNEHLNIVMQSHGNQRRLPAEVELALYRIVQEALSNTVRHANARKVSISLDYLPESVALKINDDGSGFSVPRTPTEFTSQGHFGILGLYERAELIGAHLEIQSSQNGTLITITIPTPPSKGS